jgi:hypothetical protein
VAKGEEHGTPTRCRSCAAPLHGPYCSSCGESHVYGRLELRTLVDDTIAGLRRADTPVLRTIGDLSVAPAKVCTDYLDGRRRRYINPFWYALAAVAFAFVVAHTIVDLDAGSEASWLAGYATFASSWGQLVNFLVMPLMAALMVPALSGAERELRWIEHYVVVLYGLGHVALIYGLLSPLVPYFGMIGRVVMVAMPFAYFGWIAVGVYGRGWLTVLRASAAYLGLLLVSAGLAWFLAPELLPSL